MKEKKTETNIEKLHLLQENHHKNILESTESMQKSETWFLDNTVDYWRHTRIRNSILPIIKNYSTSKWLTVGDGRYGTDANYLLKNNLETHSSDIQDELLKIGNEKGFIKEFSKQNAENLTFDDNQFDFVYCKESYHHFPRPSIAVYEMLRVAKVGIVLQEPKDNSITDSVWQGFIFFLKKSIKSLLRLRNNSHRFESSGNYLYSLSHRELQKIALGLHYRFFAYKVQQDYYEKGVEFEKITQNSKLFKKIKTKIKILEILYKIGIISGGIITGIIIKEIPNDKLINDLKNNGYKTEVLPINPYLQNEK